jgi:hypothetical protein
MGEDHLTRVFVRKWFTGTVLVALMVAILLLHGISHALTDEQKALVGLKGVQVLVSKIDPQAEHLGLTRNQIQTDVELGLRKGGVKVLTVGDMSEAPGYPALWVFVGTNIKQGLVSYSIRICLIELVTLGRGFQTTGTIWNDSAGGVRTINASEIRKIVGDLVDEFINDYLAANPKSDEGGVTMKERG